MRQTAVPGKRQGSSVPLHRLFHAQSALTVALFPLLPLKLLSNTFLFCYRLSSPFQPPSESTWRASTGTPPRVRSSSTWYASLASTLTSRKHTELGNMIHIKAPSPQEACHHYYTSFLSISLHCAQDASRVPLPTLCLLASQSTSYPSLTTSNPSPCHFN